MTTPDAPASPARPPLLTMRRFLGAGSVLLLLVLAGVPGVKDSELATLDLVHTRITAAFDGARLAAMATERPHGVSIDVVADRFVIIDEQGHPTTPQLFRQAPVPTDELGSILEPVSLSALGVDVITARFGQGGITAVFGRDGLPLAGGEIVVKIVSTPVTWTLDAVTGRLLPLED